MPGLTGVIDSPAEALHAPPAALPAGALAAVASAGGAAALVMPRGAGASPGDTFAPLLLEQQVQTVQRELDAVREELESLRRRDDALNSYMRRLDEELRLAAKLQRDFLPKALPQVGPVRFHTLFRPAGYVSGDLYDVMRLDERNVGFYLADAVGHGVPAALLTMFVKQALQTKEITPGGDGYRLLPPAEALRRLNNRLIDQNLSQSTFATALYGTIDVDTLRLTVSRAGHPAPLLLRADGPPDALEPEGSLLGIFADETFESRTVQLRPGDRIIAYTDGVEVAFWGTAGIDTRRWHEELAAFRSLTPEQLLAEFADRLDREDGSLAPKDDLTMIVVEVGPAA